MNIFMNSDVTLYDESLTTLSDVFRQAPQSK